MGGRRVIWLDEEDEGEEVEAVAPAAGEVIAMLELLLWKAGVWPVIDFGGDKRFVIEVDVRLEEQNDKLTGKAEVSDDRAFEVKADAGVADFFPLLFRFKRKRATEVVAEKDAASIWVGET